MKPNIIDVLLIAVIETTLTKLEQDNAKLREQAGAYDRLRTAHQNVKARNTTLEEQVSTLNRSVEWNYQERGVLEKEVHKLKEQLLELGRKNIALAAEVESAAHMEEALDKANRRIDELEAVLTLIRLPDASLNNVIAIAQEKVA